jgi:L,D-peptidoglycan transpeptidase YkuD (ErfK/YbiS/YcfS/YnhG family)
MAAAQRDLGERALGEGNLGLNFTATADGWFDLGGRRVRCALGRAGVLPAHEKREGDLASPAGVWPIRSVYYRPDKGSPPQTALQAQAIAPDDGWCDDPYDGDYNRPIKLPHPGSFERLWRDDGLYDLVVVLGYNDDPPAPMKGSAIFLHVAKPGYAPTEGCVALAKEDVQALLAAARPGDTVEISLPEPDR